MVFIFSNYLINVAFVAWFSAQVLKTLFAFWQTKTFIPERLVGAGGMPSSHSSLVCSLALATAKKLGYNSPEFAITVVLAAIVMYDAMGVRRAAGEQAKVLNKLMDGFKLENFLWNEKEFSDEIEGEDELEEKKDELEELKDVKLKEFLGHTPLEVLGGALLGILVAMLMPVV